VANENTQGFDDEQFAKITGNLRSMAKVLGLREAFFTDLLRERDDWSFVVKAHALLESVVCMWLSLHLGKPELEEVLAEKVEMAARVEMLSAMQLGATSERKMMRALGSLRNKLVHNVQQTDFTFAAYLGDKNRRESFADAFAMDGPGQKDFVLKNPRGAVWGAVIQIALHTVNERVKKSIEEQRNAALAGLEAAMRSHDASERHS